MRTLLSVFAILTLLSASIFAYDAVQYDTGKNPRICSYGDEGYCLEVHQSSNSGNLWADVIDPDGHCVSKCQYDTGDMPDITYVEKDKNGNYEFAEIHKSQSTDVLYASIILVNSNNQIATHYPAVKLQAPHAKVPMIGSQFSIFYNGDTLFICNHTKDNLISYGRLIINNVLHKITLNCLYGFPSMGTTGLDPCIAEVDAWGNIIEIHSSSNTNILYMDKVLYKYFPYSPEVIFSKKLPVTGSNPSACCFKSPNYQGLLAEVHATDKNNLIVDLLDDAGNIYPAYSYQYTTGQTPSICCVGNLTFREVHKGSDSNNKLFTGTFKFPSEQTPLVIKVYNGYKDKICWTNVYIPTGQERELHVMATKTPNNITVSNSVLTFYLTAMHFCELFEFGINAKEIITDPEHWKWDCTITNLKGYPEDRITVNAEPTSTLYDIPVIDVHILSDNSHNRTNHAITTNV